MLSQAASQSLTGAMQSAPICQGGGCLMGSALGETDWVSGSDPSREIGLRQSKQHAEPGQPRTPNARASLTACICLHHSSLALLSIVTEF